MAGGRSIYLLCVLTLTDAPIRRGYRGGTVLASAHSSRFTPDVALSYYVRVRPQPSTRSPPCVPAEEIDGALLWGKRRGKEERGKPEGNCKNAEQRFSPESKLGRLSSSGTLFLDCASRSKCVVKGRYALAAATPQGTHIWVKLNPRGQMQRGQRSVALYTDRALALDSKRPPLSVTMHRRQQPKSPQ